MFWATFRRFPFRENGLQKSDILFSNVEAKLHDWVRPWGRFLPEIDLPDRNTVDRPSDDLTYDRKFYR